MDRKSKLRSLTFIIEDSTGSSTDKYQSHVILPWIPLLAQRLLFMGGPTCTYHLQLSLDLGDDPDEEQEEFDREEWMQDGMSEMMTAMLGREIGSIIGRVRGPREPGWRRLLKTEP